MAAVPGEHAWSEGALLSKALLYVQKMEGHGTDDWEYGFYSSLSLEFLCRAALAHVSPTLLAEKSNWRNIYHALGYAPTSTKFAPRSATTTHVIGMLAEIVPGFTESQDFCAEHAERRNAELHSGDSEFENLETGRWLPKYYAACKTLLAFMGRELDALFKDAVSAEELIAASQDAAAKAVERDIEAFEASWQQKAPDERERLSRLADAWATRERGHRMKCPACAQTGLIRGIPQGEVTRELGDDEIIQKQRVIPSSFECVACGLKVAGLPKLVACGLGNPFTEKSTSSAAEFFGLYTEDELQDALNAPPSWDDDNNE